MALRSFVNVISIEDDSHLVLLRGDDALGDGVIEAAELLDMLPTGEGLREGWYELSENDEASFIGDSLPPLEDE